ncbi:MAG: pyruvate dehydrogenase (acetyl-transferring) E1 component subunit alpha [Halobacteriaceae archaeon]
MADSLFDRAPDDQVRVLDEDGAVVDGAAVPDLDDDELLEMYREMVLTRHFDQRAVSLQRQGRIGTYPPTAGQEGSQVGSTHALRDDDVLTYQYREHGALAVRGLEPEYLHYWMGYEDGNAYLAEKNVFPMCISIAGHLPHSTGLAMGSKLSGDDTVVVCHFGEGASSEGDFHEALNFAGVFDAPVVFVCNNNQYAISVHREDQTAAPTIAGRAAAYGFEGVQVDGMDPLASYAVMREAARKARDPAEGEMRPTLVEAIQYRYGAHTTADDPTAYRDEAEVERWRERDPIQRFEAYLRDRGLLDDDAVAAVQSSVEDEVADLVDAAEGIEPDPADLFDYGYEELPPRVASQREQFLRQVETYGRDAFERE